MYCEIHSHKTPFTKLTHLDVRAIILSGGPSSVYDVGAPDLDAQFLELGAPILGICYGQQLLAHKLGGSVRAAAHREYGRAAIYKKTVQGRYGQRLLHGFSEDAPWDVWMSHGDTIDSLPPDFEVIAHNKATPYAAIAHRDKPIMGVQFHPEVAHTPRGQEILASFVFDIADMKPSWTMASFREEQIQRLRERIGPSEKVICGLSGGVDSSVVAALLGQAIGERLQCIFVDNGFLREGEVETVRDVFGKALQLPLKVVDARSEFLRELQGVVDPERKRKIIGKLFIDVFEREAKRLGDLRFLAQGTLYPDVIESVSPLGGPSVTIKSHHNVGGLPERMKLELIEPLRELFKDEVRLLGAELGLPKHLCQRQPFPGPGLAVRILGEVNEERLRILRQADTIVTTEIADAGWDDKIWQGFAVLLPVRSVGVMGDGRTYDETIAIRAVDSVDGMTADWSRLPHELLAKISNRVVSEVRGVNRVVYDISTKPPATIEWE